MTMVVSVLHWKGWMVSILVFSYSTRCMLTFMALPSCPHDRPAAMQKRNHYRYIWKLTVLTTPSSERFIDHSDCTTFRSDDLEGKLCKNPQCGVWIYLSWIQEEGWLIHYSWDPYYKMRIGAFKWYSKRLCFNWEFSPFRHFFGISGISLKNCSFLLISLLTLLAMGGGLNQPPMRNIEMTSWNNDAESLIITYFS